MEKSNQVRLMFSFEINDFDEFSQLVKETSAYVEENEPGTISYDWYVDDTKATGCLFEVYDNPKAFEEHIVGPVFTTIVPKYRNAMTWLNIKALGDLPKAFYAMTKHLPNVTWTEQLVL